MLSRPSIVPRQLVLALACAVHACVIAHPVSVPCTQFAPVSVGGIKNALEEKKTPPSVLSVSCSVWAIRICALVLYYIKGSKCVCVWVCF